MKTLYTICFILLVSLAFAEDSIIETEIVGANLFEPAIIKIYPDSYPEVSVVFQAKNEIGQPLWLLDKEDIGIVENGLECEITRLINISKNKPINIALVVDHSGSMVDNPIQRPDGVESMQEVYFDGGKMPKGYILPLDQAKEGVGEFLNEFEDSDDSILFVGFSTTIDEVLALTTNVKKIKKFVKKLKPFGRTAFYDALYLAIDSLSAHSSKGVIVSLTDGQDNESTHDYGEVIEYAKEQEVMIFIIGLGNVNDHPLKQLTKKTNGFYYFTNDPTQLSAIYLNIKEQIKSIYQVDYTSVSQMTMDSRYFRFHFNNDTLAFQDNSTRFDLPEEAVAYLIKKEEERLQAKRNKQLAMAGVALTVVLLGIGSYIVMRRRRGRGLEANLIIVNVYPNPFQKSVTITCSVSDVGAELVVRTSAGAIEKRIPIPTGASEVPLDLSEVGPGTYFFQLVGVGDGSNVMKAVKA